MWVDCTAGALAGAAMLLLSGWLARWYALPRELLWFMGAVNLLYATYSCSLAVRARRSRGSINLLVFANLAWVPACLGFAVAFRESATPYGLAHLVGEAVFVGGLALLEWRWRHQLLVRDTEPA
ncbi:MAG TPA: hypothetical protein VE913_06030 [Longimicrobium sp.]|nr:hypothetical protein [Longimicrobium sp.]